MRIFEEDELIDGTESSKIIERGKLTDYKFSTGTGLKFSADNNLFPKQHQTIQYRDQTMEPFSSNLKSIKPMSLIFNSILKKSKLPFYNEAAYINYLYKKEDA